MTEVVNVKNFMTFINQVFPGGALFILLSDGEFKKLLMKLSSSMLEERQQQQYAVRIIGENECEGETYWCYLVPFNYLLMEL